ncbi:MAG: hypothetical protein K6L80_13885 [Agarilytica sp.]
MSKLNKLIFISVLTILWGCNLPSVYASTIVSAGGVLSIQEVENGAADALTLAVPNASGISINEFDSFEVETKSLKLLNFPSYRNINGQDEAVNAAELIIIRADHVKIRNNITLLGPGADIVFLTNTPSGSIECVYCSFNNVMRLGLLAASGANLSADATDLGVLNSGSVSEITVTDLFAPGVIGLDILTSTLSLSGDIDTHTNSMTDSRGGYTGVAHGSLIIGTASTNVMIGDLAWNYENHKIESVNESSESHVLNGVIKSTGIKVSVVGDLELNTILDTRTDLISSVSYKEGTHIPIEGVEVYTYAGGALDVNGSLVSGGVVTLSSTENLELGGATYLEANRVELIAVDNIKNLGEVHANHIALGSDIVVNEGGLYGDRLLEAWAQKEVMNQYGGHISADTVRLVSEESVVRNGSRTPYRSKNYEAEGVLGLLPNSYVAELDATKIGTYYSLNYNPATAVGVAMADSNTAHIDARQLEVRAVGFENINPYYKSVADDESLVYLSRDRLNQVRVSVEDYLAIDASSYIVNSSAQILQNSPTGMVAMHTALFANERYRVETILDYYSSSETDNDYDPLLTGQSGSLTVTDEILGTRTVAYSPPGSIVSMGYFENKSTQSFLNNTAYVEIFGNATVDTPYIKDFGFENQGVARTTASGHYTSIAFDQYASASAFSQATQAVDPNELDSLFYVHGDFIANADYLEFDADALFANHSPLDHFINQTIDMLIEENYSHLGDGDVLYNGTEYYQEGPPVPIRTINTVRTDWTSYSDQTDIDTAKESDVLTIHHIDEKTKTTTHYGYIAGAEDVVVVEDITHTSTDTFSLFDELKRLYDSMIESLSEFFNEVVWWE